MADELWEFWIDRGGTFTDIIARTPHGEIKTLKLLSVHPEQYKDAAVEGVRRLMGMDKAAAIPGEAIAAVKIGTTVATNALLERKGARVAFVTTAGFADTPIIGDQVRPDIFALELQRPASLISMPVEIEERIGPWGDVLTPLNRPDTRRALLNARARGCDAVAICLVHGVTNPVHERIAGEIAADVGFRTICISHQVDPLVKFIPRARTTLADAYLTPLVRAYADGLRDALGGAPLYFMTSGGGLVAADAFTGRAALVSGPAGGVVGMARTAQAAGHRKVIGFDMGGTSTDVSRFDGGDFERVGETTVGGWPVRAPMLAIHTVAAGGGSVLHMDAGRAQVGPASAGADPGPAAYGLGGPLTVTDANLVLGRLDARYFPEVFGPTADRPLNVDLVRKRFAKLAFDTGAESIEAAAEGFVAVAIENMAQAVRHISIAKGYNAAAYALASFGGAGGQVACRIAESLGMTTVLVHPMASLLSALGMGLADLRVWREAAFAKPLDGPGANAARQRASELEAHARQDLLDQGASASELITRTEARLRYVGSDTMLPVPLGPVSEMVAAFEAGHRRLFGFIEPGANIEIDSLAAQARAPTPGAAPTTAPIAPRRGGPPPLDLTRMYEGGAYTPSAVFRLTDIAAGNVVHGPALIVEPGSQIVVERGWRAERNAEGMLVLNRFETVSRHAVNGPAVADPVRLELFNKRFMAVAEHMGAVLERTAKSVNIKERLDFSCAVFDRSGSLVANAPHMPVHLGSMGASVRAALTRFPDLKAGDAVVLNTPFEGGTHLPDVTVIAPVCDRASGERMFFVAARGHHADIGGVEPGSMPPFSRELSEEGVAIAPMKLLANGQFQDEAIRAVLTSGPFPARAPDRNIADLKAQVAACMRGAESLHQLVADHTRPVVEAYMRHVQDNAEAAVRRVIDQLADGEAEMPMDAGPCIKVAITVDKQARTARIDFTGTSPQDPDSNFNAPAAITRAAVLYVFRALVGGDIPLNDGCLKPLDIIIPKGSLLDPQAPAAVVAGNVETSQHLVDALFAAAGALSASQGTMNNLTFGDARRQYYETIAGGAGSGPTALGCSAIHTHMTNSRLTDPEILEARYPILVEVHAVREGAGGTGAHPGGDGVIRRLRFLDAMTVSLLSSRRDTTPPGLAGGDNGAPGQQWRIHADGTREPLEGRFRIQVTPGEALEIHTPGGAGWGKA